MRKIWFIAYGVIFLFTACVKNTNPYIPPVNESFDWATTEPVKISVPLDVSLKSADSKSTGYAFTVEVYASASCSMATLVASGAVYPGQKFETVMDMPKGVGMLYVKIISPTGLITYSDYEVIGSKAVQSAAGSFTKAAAVADIEIPRPDFPNKYDVTVTKESDFGGNLTATKTYVIPQGVQIEVNNPALFYNDNQSAYPSVYVKGHLIIKGNINIANLSIIVLNGGTVTFKGRVVLGANNVKNGVMLYVQKGGKMEMGYDFHASFNNQNIVNEGEFYGNSGSTNILAGATFYNTGLVRFNSGNLRCDNGGIIYNTNKFSAEEVTLTGTSQFYNYSNGDVAVEDFTMTNSTCKLYQYGFFDVEEDFSAKGLIYNYGRLSSDVITDGSTVTFYTYSGSYMKVGAMEELKNATFEMEAGSIIGIYHCGQGWGDNYGVRFVNRVNNNKDFALILWGPTDGGKPDKITINKSDQISFIGNIENHCSRKNDSQNRHYTDSFCDYPAYWGGRDHSIPESEYNEGVGNLGGKDPVDKDGDGVPEGTDVDDNDPTVTHVSYFPAEGRYATYFFEDLWPYTGDYDMNDVVLGFRIAYYTKGEPTGGNKVVYIKFNWELSAVGTQMNTAMGIQLDDITPAMVAVFTNDNAQLANTPIDHTNNGMESGQPKAVFALFNNPAELYGQSKGINVFHDVNGISAVPVQKTVFVRFVSPVAKESLVVQKINPFIIATAEGVERGKEIHQSGYMPTAKFNRAFASGGFVSDKDLFKATNGMVWGYMVPIEFKYPLEMHSISNAYPNFRKWYESSGLNYKDWYDTTNPDNVAWEHIYDHNRIP
ncbi:MAG: LruC domain-containing protein [Bacteroidales bacterium]